MNQFPKGYQACGFHCGIKKAKDDLTVVVSDVPAAAAAVYTNNLFQAAPLVVTKAHLAQEGKAQAIVVNSGVANAAMGKQGIHDAEAVAKALADTFAIPEQYTIVASHRCDRYAAASRQDQCRHCQSEGTRSSRWRKALRLLPAVS